MRKIGEYLGLLEDTGRYDDYDGDYDDRRPDDGAARRRAAPSARRRAPSPTSPSAAAAPRAGRRASWPSCPGSPRCTRAPTTRPAPSASTTATARPVIMNLSEMDDSDAKRLVDFAAGLVFATRGTIERITNKVFLLSPPNVTRRRRGQAAHRRGRLLQPELTGP